MGLFEKIGDMAVKGLTKSETKRLPYDELVKMVEKEFIVGADDNFLKNVIKTAKGQIFAGFKELKSADERYTLHVGSRPNGALLLSSKPVWVYDNQEDKFYQLDKNIRWKKFYKAVEAIVKNKWLKGDYYV